MQKQVGNYELLKELGRGAYATVYLGRDQKTNELVAIKQLLKPREKQKMENIDQEIAVLYSFENSNIIKMLKSQDDQQYIYLVLEYCALGDLQIVLDQKFKQQNGFPEDLAQLFAQQLQYAFLEMYHKNIIHRDLKLANILMNQEIEVKIADFGFAKFQENNHAMSQSAAGTPLTMAPEVILNEKYNQQCDIWSLGVILYQMVYGKLPFDPGHGKGLFSLIELLKEHKNNKSLVFPKEKKISDSLKDLLNQMIKYDMNERIGIEKFLQHPWMQQQINGEEIKNKYKYLFEQEINCIEAQFSEQFGKKLRNFVEANIQQFLDRLRGFIGDLQQLENLEEIQEILHEIKNLLNLIILKYEFTINGNKLKLHQNCIIIIEMFISSHLTDNLWSKKYQEKNNSDPISNKAGILGVPNNFMKNMLKLVGLQQKHQEMHGNEDTTYSDIAVKLCELLALNGDDFSILKKINVRGSYKERVQNINLEHSYHNKSVININKSKQNQNNLNQKQDSDNPYESYIEEEKEQKEKNQNQFENYNLYNAIESNKSQEEVEIVDIDDGCFEDENDIEQEDIIGTLQLVKQASKYQQENQKELTQKEIDLEITDSFMPFYLENELKNINLIKSFYL